ncbi:MAG TPA: tRNA lysidine(34) synthetase TilS [Aggregatilineales bacterium]|nr:tRNA lysidine(34) synthetase TilS [Anaerolineales bacterium]HRE46891.1 tRNA lysidine(34) synthetase TilS [Aggregatilineales bacterium]
MTTHTADQNTPFTPNDLIEKVRTYCRDHKLFPNERALVAVSGGVDSLVLLHILKQFVNVTAATFDHQLRGTVGAEDVAYVQQIGAAWGVLVVSGAGDVVEMATRWRVGTETAGRRARYAFLANVAAQMGVTEVAVAHHRDDQAETVLLHVIRGAGLSGLRGMLPRTPIRTMIGTGNDADLISPALDLEPIHVVRPLLEITRAEIEAYAAAEGIIPRHDASNDDLTFTRNRIRHEVIPLLETINPEVSAALGRLAILARDDEEAIRSLLPPISQRTGEATFSWDAFRTLPSALRRITIREAARLVNPEIDLTFSRLIGVADQLGRGRLEIGYLGGGVTIEREESLVSLYDPTIYPPDSPWLPSGTHIVIPSKGRYKLAPDAEKGWTVHVHLSETPPPPTDDPLVGIFPMRRDAQAILRTPRPGDSYTPKGMSGTQKVGDALTNLKVRRAYRDRIPVLSVDDRILWFVPPGVKGRYAADAESEMGTLWWVVRFVLPEGD